jgi:hypothetical protein
MTDSTRGETRAPPASAGRAQLREGAAAERSLARAVAVGLPVASVAGAVVAGVAAGPGSGLLVLASGALLGTIALLWASLRTLSGDAPLPLTLEFEPAHRIAATDLSERKRRVLRALKDLQSEHELGKIDDADYEAIAARYREEAKAIMKDMDRQTGPARAEAERIAQEYLSHRARGGSGLSPKPISASADERADRPPPDERADRRIACPSCGVSNEEDAAYCKRCAAALRATAQ